MGPPGPKSTGPVVVVRDRLDSWKEIAAHLNRDVRTVQRWEATSGLPVHRFPGGPKAGVFAYRSELDAWSESRRTGLEEPPAPVAVPTSSPPKRRRLRLWIAASAVLLLLVLAGAAVLIMRSPQVLVRTLQQAVYSPFAMGLQVQVCPAWSPDGRSIAFTTGDGAGTRLMIQAVGGSAAVAVTGPGVSVSDGGDPTWCRPPVWSPDSQWLYFHGSEGAGGGIYRVAASGGPAARMQSAAFAPAISGDGGAMVFLARSPQGQFGIWTASPPDGPRKPYLPAPFETAVFANRPRLGFAPDGRHILATITLEREHETQFWLLPWPPGPPRRLFARAEAAITAPPFSWMPDSQHLVLAAGPMIAANIRTERYWPIAVTDHPIGNPTVSPDGSRVAYQSSLSHTDVISLPLSDGPSRILLGTAAWEQMPSCSPSAPEVAYVNTTGGRMDIRVRSLSDDHDRLLASLNDVRVRGDAAHLLMTPAFSPDGGRVAFLAVAPKGRGIFIVPASGGTPVAAGISGNSPGWSPDGVWLLFRRLDSKRSYLAKWRVGSTEPPVDLAPTCGLSMPEWSPSGEWIAYTNANCRSALITPDGQRTVELGGFATVAWSRDGRTLYRLDPAEHALLATDIDTMRERRIRDVGALLPHSGPQPGLRASLTSDGKSIVYSVLNPREEIWILENPRIGEPWFLRLRGLLPR